MTVNERGLEAEGNSKQREKRKLGKHLDFLVRRQSQRKRQIPRQDTGIISELRWRFCQLLAERNRTGKSQSQTSEREQKNAISEKFPLRRTQTVCSFESAEKKTLLCTVTEELLGLDSKLAVVQSGIDPLYNQEHRILLQRNRSYAFCYSRL